MFEKIKLNLKKLPELVKGPGHEGVMIRGASSALVIKVSGVAISLGVSILLARLLGAHNFGEYIYVLTCIEILTVIAKMGFDTASLRFVSEYNARQDWGLLRGYLQRSWQIVLLVSIALSTVMGIAIWGFSEGMAGSLKSAFFVGVLLLPIYAFLGISSIKLQALKRIIPAQAPLMILRPILIIVGVLVVSVLNKDQLLDASTTMIINVIATGITLSLLLWFLHRFLAPVLKHVHESYRTQDWFKVSLPLLMVSGSIILINQTDIVMVGIMLDTTSSGIYAVATKIVKFVTFGLVAVNAIIAPLISELYAKQELAKLQRIVSLAACGVFAFTVLVGAGIIMGGDFILALFGDSFTAGRKVLSILIIGQIFIALSGSTGGVMSMTGLQNELAVIIALSAIINITLNAVLIPIYGFEGAAVASVITNILWNVVLIVIIQRKIHINTTIWPVIKKLYE